MPKSKKMIVILSRADWAGSCYAVCQAINATDRFECYHITMHQHIYKYPSGIVLPICFVPNPGKPEDYPEYEKIQDIFSKADAIHLWNDIYSVLNEIIPVPRDKVKSYTFTGSVYREHHTMINSHARQVGIKMVVQDPMFLFPNEIDATFIPHAVNTDKLRPVPIKQKESKTIGCYTPHHHSTTAREDIQLLESILKSKYPDWQTTMGTHCSWEERMDQLSRCMFFM